MFRGAAVPCPAASATPFNNEWSIMSDHYVKVKVQFEQMKSFGEDAEKEGADTEVQVTESVSPATPSITTPGTDSSKTPISCKHRNRSRSKPSKEDKNKHISDLSLHGSVAASHVGKNSNRIQHDRTLHVKGTGSILQGRAETNGNIMPSNPPKNIQETRRGDGFKQAKKKRPVTVDTSKAKTSLEALKISIKQLKWKEVCFQAV